LGITSEGLVFRNLQRYGAAGFVRWEGGFGIISEGLVNRNLRKSYGAAALIPLFIRGALG